MPTTLASRITGIYKITCTGNRKFYIGSSVSIKDRWSAHRNMLRNGKHGNRHLQNAWNKYGPDSFVFEVIERCSPESLIEREQHWLDSTDAANTEIGMNNSPTATTTTGFKHSEATKKLLSEMRKAQPLSTSFIAYAESLKGKPSWNKGIPGKKWTEEMKQAASLVRRGITPWNKGVPQTKEHTEKIRAGAVSTMRVFSDEVREQIKRLRLAGMPYREISEVTGVSLSQCAKIANNVVGKYKSIKARK